MTKKSSARAAPIVSSAAAVSGGMKKTAKSAILRSAFSPSQFQLSLFASVIQGLDGQPLRIHEVISGTLKCERTIPRANITCLDWGYYGSKHRSSEKHAKKKRRKLEASNGDSSHGEDVVLALGTNHSEIHLFSPVKDEILAVLKEGHTLGIKDFKFKDFGSSSEAWSLGGDGKLVQWNVRKHKVVRTIDSPTSPATTLLPLASSILVSSHSTYLIDSKAPTSSALSFSGDSPIHMLLAHQPTNGSQNSTVFLTAAENERHITVFNISSPTLIGSLVAGNDVESIAAFEELGVSETDGLENGMLAAVTKDGEVSIFSSPFHFVKVKDAKSLKEERKQLTRKPIATLKVTRPDKSSVALQIVSASFQGDELVIAVAESVTNVSFERVPWRDEHGGLRLEGESVIMKARIDGHESTINGVKDMGKVQIDESQTIIENGGHVDDNVMAIDPPQPEVIDISSGEEESSEESEGDDEAEEAIAPKLTNGIQHDDAEMEETSQGNADTEMVEAEAEAEPVEEEEPTFGDLLRQKNDGLIDVSATFHPDGPDHNLIPYDSSRPLEIPSGLSMGTVLAQSLRTNDTALLESCFRVEDLKIVRATIERLDSSLATVLLTKLAEKLHSRPGRAGTLMVWVQWTMVAHGGYLASRPDVVSKLKALNRVIAERASSLGPLLRLKGKLDMLEAQMHLRKNVQRQEKGYGAEIEDMEGITYIEGQEESSSEDEVEDNAVDATLNLPPNTFKPSSDDDEEMEDFNDFESEYEEGSESNLDDSESDREKRFIDDEASSTDNENSEEEEVNYDDKDSVSGFDTDSSDGDSEIGIDLERVVNGVKRKR